MFNPTIGAGIFLMASAGPLLLSRFLLFFSSRKRKCNISELWIYPIKGCRGYRVTHASITRRGFAHDRMLMVVSADNRFISQRSHPKMTLISTRIDGDVLVVNAPGRPELCIPLPRSYDGPESTERELLRVTVWKSECEAYEVGEVSSWFSDFLSRSTEIKENLRLVRMANSCVRECKLTDGKGQTGFADAFPFLLVTRNSVTEINTRLMKPITLEHFRPNIVLEGNIRPFEEDSWKKVSFYNSRTSSKVVEMRVVNPCSRCKVPTNNPETGQFDSDNEPMRTMKSFREGRNIGIQGEDEREIFFGVNLDHGSTNDGILYVGDTLSYVL